MPEKVPLDLGLHCLDGSSSDCLLLSTSSVPGSLLVAPAGDSSSPHQPTPTTLCSPMPRGQAPDVSSPCNVPLTEERVPWGDSLGQKRVHKGVPRPLLPAYGRFLPGKSGKTWLQPTPPSKATRSCGRARARGFGHVALG
ncbi:uncharacterized protein LOC125132382 isoform X3 [Phacochoerus africanus]|uniref:uncharacterized protein LOC125132382 isoform X3 n=1 Tax=Phacochoerus africanus TaxID=41426 RepID=UPI001FD9437D|nr:uncharacterized protein LOC125132382 isoform X3 [Phacochoerus africanus]